MLDLEPIKERLAWVDEEGLNGYTWDIKDTHSQYRDLVAEVERLQVENERLRGALNTIKRDFGHVCAEFEICQHPPCTSSYAAWMIADQALTTPSHAKEDQAHAGQ